MLDTYESTKNGNGTMTKELNITRKEETGIEQVNLDAPGFGVVFSDHMFQADYENGKWQNESIVPFGTLEISPAMCMLHYGQAIFEGLKAFHTEDGSVNIFRPDAHHERLNSSCRRMCIPETDYNTFMAALENLLTLDREWIPKKRGNALYIRPFVFATGDYLSVKVSDSYKFLIITSPVGAYYKEGFNPVSLITSDEYARAVQGGVGNVKAPGNYAASLLPAEKATQAGYTQVLWLDALHKNYIEEVGTMNIFFKIDGTLVTPELNGAILPGITRDSVLTLAELWGVPVEQRRISIDEIFEVHESGALEEVFGTGTAAVISPVGSITHKDKTIKVNGSSIGPFAEKMFNEITGIQCGEKEDPFGWIHKVA